MAAKSFPKYVPKPAEGEEIPVSILGIESRPIKIWIASKPISIERFPPCIKNILSRSSAGAGKHRACAVLAAFLGQVGWNELEASKYWKEVADRSEVSEKIFEAWFQKMHCPRCDTIGKESRKYPHLGLADFGYCQPDDICKEFRGPVEYAADVKMEDDRSSGELKHIKTLNIASIYDWAAGREGEVEISSIEKDDLENLLKEQTENKRLIYTRVKVMGKLRPKFFLKEMEGPRRRVLSEIL